MPTAKPSFVLFVRAPLLALFLLLVVMGTFSKRGFLDWRRITEQNSILHAKLAEVQFQKQDLEKQIHALERDREAQETVVRRFLGYIKPNETVIEFE